jgi:NitT/TauT family transport system ATP-binding protein
MLAFRGIRMRYEGGAMGEVAALDGIDLAVRAGEFVALIGASGCGKSTLLRIAADLQAPSAGEVTIAGHPPRTARLRREIGFVFQEPALPEWRTVLDNVALPLELQGVPVRTRHARATELLDLVGLAGFERAWPRELSGGMRQRAAIARAMITEPRVLLMDEPFGALDQITRDRLNLELLGIVERTGITILLVTHSIREAVLMADRVVVMTPRPGRIARILDVPAARPRRLGFRDEPLFQALVAAGTEELERGFRP